VFINSDGKKKRGGVLWVKTWLEGEEKGHAASVSSKGK